ncbi:histidine ammonia-lyase [Myxococcus xanthus DK 1622]|uniref:Histidine ammonia-lyase n=1 Tax=Myxococcus xanthus (strain DK1622) TaxID=246197 RepID=HUTH_MYXXD|nr:MULTISPECIES: histidine ammonia-lyase [Myxococcus]Q1D6R1.1 RecName: Full=Histidine ammonia-lyase; Short=Histidase [Myxococcus xanthus DK 1622]ABF90953.1 histidine ammonia-lyase [Myxococcus xanthus DK 1622]NOJ52015.1 histidine ammonia-lyase [Myxococcus xanthus]QPM82890.1 histidine ammonia-lyase [Myxococcus xanthus]QVW65196.1 histidine ammonia-lyase [Myxococcus xanthus DZ2]QZZ51164.1 Histidine ammonia-lyase [Myxococcus xanthus]
MSRPRILIDGDTLKLEEILQVARNEATVELSPDAATRVRASRALVDRVAAGDTPAYGINTGFGTLAEVRIDKKDLRDLQRNLILSHACGVGTPLPLPEARALLLLRCNVLAKGYSGIRMETLALALDMLNRDVVPVVPERGSVGASGDLAPLAHLALVFIGEGEAFYQGQRMPAKQALERAGLQPVVLEAKEGLALVNGTQAMCAVGTLLQLRAESLADIADVAGAMTLEGLLGSHKPFIPEIHDVRAHPGQKDVAAHLRRILVDSELVESHVNCSKVQDPYSLRCMPQVHGAAREGIAFSRRILEVEVNSATDNPLVFADTERIVSGGNFHGQPISLAMDVVAMALTQLSSISERRVEQLVNPSLSNLPAFLAKNSGLNSGFMIAQVTSAALVAESRVLSHPASVDSIPSSAGREDHVSMGMTAALKGRQVSDFARSCLAIEILVAAQALDFRLPLKPGKGALAAYELVRSKVPHMDKDRELHRDIEAVSQLVDSGELLAAVRSATA